MIATLAPQPISAPYALPPLDGRTRAHVLKALYAVLNEIEERRATQRRLAGALHGMSAFHSHRTNGHADGLHEAWLIVNEAVQRELEGVERA